MLSLSVINKTLPENYPSFDGRTVKGYFTISEDQPYFGSTEMLQVPKILPAEKRNKLIGRNLEDGYKTAIPLIDYMAYYKMKETAFLKWLRQHYTPQSPPDFICFGGRIADTLTTPLMFNKRDKWDFFATKFNNSLYLWTEPERWHNIRNKASYFGLSLQAFLAGQDPLKKPLDETKQSFVIQERKFGTHQLLLVTDVDGIDDAGNWVEIKACERSYLQTKMPKMVDYKFRKCWAQCVVAGQTKAIFGGKQDGYLQQIDELQMKDLLKKAGINFEDVGQCYDFQDRLLRWIQSQFQDNEFTVKKFCWQGLGQQEKDSEIVTCTEVDETNSSFAQQLKATFI